MSVRAELERQIAQKLMIDIRYFDANLGQEEAGEPKRRPVTELPIELAQLIQKTELGGVILFTENCQHPQQVRNLTQDLQRAAASAPLFISIDQEGGRVLRTPRHLTTGFSGSLAIGATYAEHGTRFAAQCGKVLATELNAMGININHGTVLDVNANPNNPVINVRAFGDDPLRIGELGLAHARAMEQQGIGATVKHFPGHGDTDVDSHTGLPRVEHCVETVWQQELAPYQKVFSELMPAMVMTAHIQYPALDSSELTTASGHRLMAPATMSSAIISELLRDQLGYDGVVITDALDMAGIAAFMSPVEAVVNCFNAGVDIALMPIKIRSRRDLKLLPELIAKVADAVEAGELCAKQLRQSHARINKLKQQFEHRQGDPQSLPLSVVGCHEHQLAQEQLAQAAITLVKGTLPLIPELVPESAPKKEPEQTAPEIAKPMLILMPHQRQAEALANALMQIDDQLHLQPMGLVDGEVQQQKESNQQSVAAALADCEQLICGFVSPRPSAAEFGGIEDLSQLDEQALINAYSHEPLLAWVKQAKTANKPVTFISLRAPYDLPIFAPWCERQLASYAYMLDCDKQAPADGVIYRALAKALLGQQQASGSLPLSLDHA
ncbi:glycoside hydrolase family 3 protein [Ferrimonas aestuarii]|uniref:beta-N-acetylhexosaminidase n=1 Tax=Ferrimonas aestuarii TaxID=2569539 RepID=A0A4U1BJP2_9GAMM|nr:glycoside hydrolase family 3 protein [Ferrimonas aestuarii]TKB51797.1 glycoside hydrolase family 3 protein [Ferrimonas aestuarii]